MPTAARAGPWLLFLLVAAVYAPTLRNGFVYDDHEVILAQRAPRSLAQTAQIFAERHGLPYSRLPYYRPVTRATLLAQKALHGERASLFHAVNALGMAATAVAAYSLLRRPGLGIAPTPALLAAAIFALHPVASECVHPIASGRESLLPALFAVAALSAFLAGGRGAALAAALFAASLFSKEQAIVLPALFALADALALTPDPPRRSLRRWLSRQLPFLAVVLLYLGVRSAIFEPAPPGAFSAALERNPLGPLHSLLYALQVTLAPFVQLVYEPAREVWWSPPRLAFALALALALGAGVVTQGAAGRRRLAFWGAWFVLAQILTANVFPQEAPFAERWVFLAWLALPALAATGVSARWERPLWRRAGLAAGVAIALACAALSVHRGVYYRDSLHFHAQWVRTSPGHANARFNLGTALAEAGRVQEALPELRAAIALAPGHAGAHFNLAAVLAQLGRFEEAAAEFRETLRLDPRDASAHEDLARVLERSGLSEEAASHRAQARRLRGEAP